MTSIIKRAVQTVTEAVAEHAVAKVEAIDAVSIGAPVSRIDGRLKVTGAARYSSDTLLPDMAHAVLVPSPIARGRITRIDAAEAVALPGVLAVITHEIYHLVMARLLPKPRLDAATPQGQIERILLNGLDEGMATHVTRFEPTGEGRISRLNRRIAALNEIRAGANFTLFSALLATAARGEGVSADDAGIIAYSGAYDDSATTCSGTCCARWRRCASPPRSCSSCASRRPRSYSPITRCPKIQSATG